MVAPFEEISFLTRSENRVTVLTTLADAPRTERELVDETGISDVTAGRILEDFLDRGWIHETEGTYRASEVGDLLAADYRRLEGSMDLACRLAPVVEFLPIEEMDFDLRHLTDARVSDPERFSPISAVDRWKELVRGADRVVSIAPIASAATVVARVFLEEIVENDLQLETVVSTEYYRTVTERSEYRRVLRDIIQAGAELYRAPESADPLPFVATFDDLAGIAGYDGTGTVRVGIESRAEPICEWIHDRYETYRAASTRLTPADFAG